MLNKILNMQKLMLRNGMPPFGNGNSNIFAAQKYTSSDKFFAMALMAISMLYLFTVDGSMIFIVVASITALITGGFVTYNNDVIETIPVTKRFIFFNLHLGGFVIFISGYLIYMLASYIIYAVIFLGTLLLTRGNIASSSSTYVLGMEGSFLMLLMITVYYFTITSIMFIKNKKLRFATGISFSLGYLVFLRILKNRIAAYPNTSNETDIFNKFQLIPGKLHILQIYTAAAVVAAILSILIGYILYTRKR